MKLSICMCVLCWSCNLLSASCSSPGDSDTVRNSQRASRRQRRSMSALLEYRTRPQSAPLHHTSDKAYYAVQPTHLGTGRRRAILVEEASASLLCGRAQRPAEKLRPCSRRNTNLHEWRAVYEIVLRESSVSIRAFVAIRGTCCPCFRWGRPGHTFLVHCSSPLAGPDQSRGKCT